MNARRDLLPSNDPYFLLNYLENISSDDSDSDFDGYVDDMRSYDNSDNDSDSDLNFQGIVIL